MTIIVIIVLVAIIIAYLIRAIFNLGYNKCAGEKIELDALRKDIESILIS